jgi:hypothetical protein
MSSDGDLGGEGAPGTRIILTSATSEMLALPSPTRLRTAGNIFGWGGCGKWEVQGGQIDRCKCDYRRDDHR